MFWVVTEAGSHFWILPEAQSGKIRKYFIFPHSVYSLFVHIKNGPEDSLNFEMTV